MSDRVSMTRTRFAALVGAAMDTPCFCALPEQRAHDGMCISCWALLYAMENDAEGARGASGVEAMSDDDWCPACDRTGDPMSERVRVRHKVLRDDIVLSEDGEDVRRQGAQ